MKQIIAILAAMFIVNGVNAQELEVHGGLSKCSNEMFDGAFAYGIGYNQIIGGRHRLGLGVSDLVKSSEYQVAEHNNSDGRLLAQRVSPNNHRYGLSLSYAYRFIDNQNASLAFGVFVGYTFYRVKGTISEYRSMDKAVAYPYSDAKNGNWALGCLMEYEIKQIVCKQLSSFVQIRPEATYYEHIGMIGSNNPTLLNYVGINIGLRYSFAKNQAND